jgi:long-chain acyl-CoA synthetase
MIAILRELVGHRRLAAERSAVEWLADFRECRRNLGVAFLEAACEHSSVPALVTASKSISYESIAVAALNVANFLAASMPGQSGKRVLLLSENSAEYLAGFYGILLAGHVAVPLPAAIEPARLERIQASCGAELLLITARLAAKRSIFHQSAVQFISLNSLPEQLPASKHSHNADLAVILHTSGSTDQPKGVMLSHANLLSNAKSILAFLPIRPADRALALLPFCHAYGNSVLQTHMLAGATLVVDGSPTFPNSIVDALRQHEINSFAAVPDLCQSLLNFAELGREPLPSLRYITVAGGALKPDDAIRLSERVSPAEVYLMYGQTEATARLAYLPPAELRSMPGSIGRAIPGVELEVRNEHGKPTSEPGELWARGPNVMLGYWNDESATAQALQDGWLRTGDLAQLDEQGFIFLHGRRTHELKLRGIRVDLAAITTALERRLPMCHLALVPFQKQELTRLALFLESSDARAIPPAIVGQACRDALARHEQPHYIEVLPNLPRTATWKLDYPALCKRAEEHFQADESRATADARPLNLLEGFPKPTSGDWVLG